MYETMGILNQHYFLAECSFNRKQTLWTHIKFVWAFTSKLPSFYSNGNLLNQETLSCPQKIHKGAVTVMFFSSSTYPIHSQWSRTDLQWDKLCPFISGNSEQIELSERVRKTYLSTEILKAGCKYLYSLFLLKQWTSKFFVVLLRGKSQGRVCFECSYVFKILSL